MPITPDQIIEETAEWPADAVADLLDRIASAKHGGVEMNRMAAWTEIADRRSRELDAGDAKLIPGDAARERIRQIVGR